MFCYIHGVFQDKAIFPEPNKFNPDRFIDENGIYNRDPRLVLFGVGRRRCPGELMARNENFLFTARIVQNFKVYTERPENPSDIAIEPSGPAFVPVDANFYVKPREEGK